MGQGLKRQQRIKGSGLPSPPTHRRHKVVPSLINDTTHLSSQLNATNSSKLFIASDSTTTPHTPVSSDCVGVALGDHVTDHMTQKGFRSDIFVTSTPMANDVI